MLPKLQTMTTILAFRMPFIEEFQAFLSFILSFLYAVFDKIGIISVPLVLVLFALVVQLCRLPVKIFSKISNARKQKKARALKSLKKEYEKSVEDDEKMKEFEEKKREVEKKYRTIPFLTPALLFLDILFVIASFSALAVMNAESGPLASLTNEKLTAAYNFFGINLLLSANEAPFPNGVLALVYLGLHLFPFLISLVIQKRKQFKADTVGMTAEEIKEYKKEHRFNPKRDGHMIYNLVMKLSFPLIFAGVVYNRMSLYLLYWIFSDLLGRPMVELARRIYLRIQRKGGSKNA